MACKVFSDGFSEGQARNINGGLPPDSLPHTEHYDYLSDSDLEDESCSGEGDEEPQFDDCTEGPVEEEGLQPPQSPQGLGPQPLPPVAAAENSPQLSKSEIEDNLGSAQIPFNYKILLAHLTFTIASTAIS